MAARRAKRQTDRLRDGHPQADQTVSSNRKRHRRAEDTEDKDYGEEPKRRFKRSKTQIDSRERQTKVEQIQPATARSPRLRTLREAKDQLRLREESRTKRSPVPAETQDRTRAQLRGRTSGHRGQKCIALRSRNTDSRLVSRKQGLPKQGDSQARPLESSKARRGVPLLSCVAGKRRRAVDSEDDPSRIAKRERLQSVVRAPVEERDYIESWLNDSCASRRPSFTEAIRLSEASDTMPRKTSAVAVLLSPEESFEGSTTTSRKSVRSTTSVHDSGYRQSLRQRNIHINREEPSSELMQRAKEIIFRSRASPEMDDEAIEQLIKTSRRVEDEGEEVIIQQLASGIIPAMITVPDLRLASNADQPWSNSVPVPLDPDVLTNPLPLPKPKPDLTFGYSQNAFSRKQLMTTELLIDDEFGRSYAVPDQKLQFPFLDIEFKSQAKGGTHYIATNQAAGAGAIAANGNLELAQRSFGLKDFDFDEPQFFSVTMDHELVRINVHWLKAPTIGTNQSFHIECLSQHLLSDNGGIRAVTRAIKNILDYGVDTRLQALCGALDAYREIVVRDRLAAEVRRPRSAGKVTREVIPKRIPPRRKISGDTERPRRQSKPSQKLMDNGWDVYK